jgi:dipeptidyl aminopeptidase/acylaminoacyl peptidase
MQIKTLSSIIYIFLILNTTYSQSIDPLNSKIPNTNRLPLDKNTLGNWPRITDTKLSKNGIYVAYVVQEFFPENVKYTIVKHYTGSWEKRLKHVTDFRFSNDSNHAYFTENGKLYVMTLGDIEYKLVGITGKYSLLKRHKSEILLFDNEESDMCLTILDMTSNKKTQFKGEKLISYFETNGEILLVLKNKVSNASKIVSINLENKKMDTVWDSKSYTVKQIISNSEGNLFAFIVDNNIEPELWLYQSGQNAKSILSIMPNVSIIDYKKLSLAELGSISNDGERIQLWFQNLKSNEQSNNTLTETNGFDIWNFKDSKLQSRQLIDLTNSTENTKHLFTFDIKTQTLRRIQLESDIYMGVQLGNEYIVVRSPDTTKKVLNTAVSSKPNPYQNYDLILVSQKDGSRKKLPWNHVSTNHSMGSPSNKYIIYWEKPQTLYYSYEIKTNTVRVITSQINADFTMDSYRTHKNKFDKGLVGTAGWISNDEAILIYDRNDIWLVDPKCKNKPRNITNGYGLKNNLIFRIANDNESTIYQKNDTLILLAFNLKTKQNGYFYITLAKQSDPVLLTMGDYLYSSYPYYSHMHNSGFIKSENNNAYLVKRCTSSSYPNYYWSTNLKTFNQVTNLNPEKSFNWLTTELITWKSFDQDSIQAVVYKPENLNPLNKYPVIITYYTQRSNELNEYKFPEWTSSEINIPWFVSQGYIVITPDFNYRLPNLRQSLNNIFAPLVKYISNIPYIDNKRIGLFGHSFGGLETGLLITDSMKFAAACAAHGYFNLTSDVGTILPTGDSRGAATEGHMGGTLWEYQSDYINNSPIFKLNNVSTPLLIVTGKLDDNVPYDQSIELYIGMCRLNKPTWMISYDNESHVISRDKRNTIDFTIRLTQFFDHYLKKEKCPQWMSIGLPAEKKGKDLGYQLVDSIACDPQCNICNPKYEK